MAKEEMYGKFTSNFDEKLVDNKRSDRWLKYGDIKGETESSIVATYDQAVSK
jgi:hypothetical protein